MIPIIGRIYASRVYAKALKSYQESYIITQMLIGQTYVLFHNEERIASCPYNKDLKPENFAALEKYILENDVTKQTAKIKQTA
jgi:hypothetical protein